MTKEDLWQQERARVEKITDKIGLPIDEGIKEAVTAFRVHGFATSQSCEGHDDHGAPYPWIEIYTAEPTGWREGTGEEKEKLDEQWLAENLTQQVRMMDLLAEFYKNRDVPFDVRLTFDRVGAFGGFRVQSFGAQMHALLPKTRITLYKQEMREFSSFLKDMYFSVIR